MRRRDILLGALGAAATWPPRPLRAAIVQRTAPASSGLTPVNFDLPPGACDCHVHVFADPKEFPYFAGRVYTPELASPEALANLHRALHLQRVVVVQPSVYGTDNSATLYGMKARGTDARGVAVIDEKTPDSELDAMGRAGIRGIRLNLATAGIESPAVGRDRLQKAIERIARREWHVQVNTSLQMIAAIKDIVAKSSVPIVFDHFGSARGELGLTQPGFADLVELVRSGRAHVKISAAYRSSDRQDVADVAPLAKALIAANIDRVLWGSDWPHPDSRIVPGRKPTDIAPPLRVDDGLMLNQLALWAPDAAVRRKILVDNPAKLYRF